MKVTELFEEVKDLGTLEIVGDGDALTVRSTAKSGPMLSGLYWVWDAVGRKKGVTTKMMKTQRFGSPRPVELTGNDGLKIIDKRPTKLMFTGISRADLEAAVEKAIAKVHKENAANQKYKADAPKRKAEASKFAAEKRKTDMAEYDKKYGKGTWKRITYRQEGGDDGYSYVVRVDGRAKWNGLTQREAMHYKEREADKIAKDQGIGKYATVKEQLDESTNYDELYGNGTWDRVSCKEEGGGKPGYRYVVRADGQTLNTKLSKMGAEQAKLLAVQRIAKRERLGTYGKSNTGKVKEDLVTEDSSGKYGIYRKQTYTATKNGGGFKNGDEIYVTSAMHAPEYRVIVNNPDGKPDVDDIPCTYADLKAAGIVGEPTSRSKASKVK
jgi:hypothetical protein